MPITVGSVTAMKRRYALGRAEPASVGETRASEGFRVQGSVLGSEQGAEAIRTGPRPTLADFPGIEPVAPKTRLALSSHVFLEPVGRGLVEREGGDPGAPEADVDAGGLLERRGERLVQVAGAHGELGTRMFRIGHIGYYDVLDITTALTAVETLLVERGAPIEPGVAVARALEAYHGAARVG